MPEKPVQKIVDSIEQLRPLPSSVSRVLKALEEPNSTAGTIADFIGLDQALSASVIQMANSAGLGYAKDCLSLREAVMRLGFKRLKILVMGAGAAGPLTRRLAGYRLGSGELWHHSLSAAVVAQWVAQAVRYPKPEEAYVAGLLHDIGKLLLDQFILEDYGKIYDRVQREQLCLWQVEEELFGIDHAGVGCRMTQKWSFPQPLIEAIHYHHAPGMAIQHEELPAIVNIANAFTAPQSPLLNVFEHVTHPASLHVLGLTEARLEKMQQDATEYLFVHHTPKP
jgi:putative nucleotidyltransferase with HDIG domain